MVYYYYYYYLFNDLDFAHLCLDIPVPSINKDFIIIIIIIIITEPTTFIVWSIAILHTIHVVGLHCDVLQCHALIIIYN